MWGEGAYRNFFKRAADIVIALIGLPFFVIIYIFLAPLIKIVDNGPIFYSAQRVGKNGNLFKMFKFRSMVVNAPDIRLPDGSTYNTADDPRVTGIGKFLRKTSLDETPQLLNVLAGDMSLVGPRPDPPDWLDKYPEDIKVFLTVRPGITGYNQANFRNSADGKEKMINDAFYALNCSFVLDVKIFLKTIAILIRRKNIYKDVSYMQISNNSNADTEQVNK